MEAKTALALVGLSFFVFGPREVTRRHVSSMCWATIWLPFEIIAFMLPGARYDKPPLLETEDTNNYRYSESASP